MTEEWRDIPSCAGYQASSLGRVRVVDREVRYMNGRVDHRKGYVVPTYTRQNGYVYAHINLPGRVRKFKTVHSLVAEAFHGCRPTGSDVMHLNGDRTDNRPCNLAYGTRSENLRQSYEYGGKHSTGKLSLREISEIREKLGAGVPAKKLAAVYGVHVSTIRRARARVYGPREKEAV